MSGITGQGVDQFLEEVDRGREEYETEYQVEYERLRKEKEKVEMERIGKTSGKGTDVKMGLCHTMRREVEEGIFLRPAGDEEAELEEERNFAEEEESREEASFRSYVASRKERMDKQIEEAIAKK